MLLLTKSVRESDVDGPAWFRLLGDAKEAIREPTYVLADIDKCS
jgi:hypothetical protein